MTEFIQSIESFVLNLFGGNSFWAIFFIAALPLVELRGSILFGKALLKKGYSINNFEVFISSYLGAMTIVLIILLCLMPVMNWLKKTVLFSKIAHKLELKFKQKSEKIDGKKNDIFKMAGIILFVAIPVPGTGGWMASAVAVFIGLGFLKSLLAIGIGNLICAGIMMLISDILRNYIEIVLLIFFIFVFIIFLYAIYGLFIKKPKANAK